MIALALLQYAATTYVNTARSFFPVGNFGFETNSTFSLQFSHIQSSDLIYCLFSQEEYELYPINRFPIADLCANSLGFPTINRRLLSDNYSFTGVISDPGVYHQVIVNCEDPETIPIKTVVRIDQKFHNPSTHLDSRWLGVTYPKFLFILLYMLCVIIWCANWAYRISSRIPLHGFMSALFWILCGVEVIRYVELRHLDSEDRDGGLTIVRIIGRIISRASMAFVLISAAKGWCITHCTFPTNDVLCFSTLAFVSSGIWWIQELAPFQQFEVPAGMLSVLAGAVVAREICISCSDSAVNSWIYLLAIRRADIDPRTTPVYRRYKIFKRLRWTVAIVALCWIADLVTVLFFAVPFWLSETFHDALRLLFIAACGWIFHIQACDFNGRYAYLSPADDTSDSNSPTDVETIIASEIAMGGSAWHQGMWLPAEPAQTSAHHGRIKPRDRADSIDITIGEDLLLGD
jgi:hypothetical protein